MNFPIFEAANSDFGISFVYAEICTDELIVSGSYFPVAGLSDLSWGRRDVFPVFR